MQRLLSLSALVMLLFVLAACGGSNDAAPGPNPPRTGGNPPAGGSGGSSSNADLVYAVKGEQGLLGWKLNANGDLNQVPGSPAEFAGKRIGVAAGGTMVFAASTSQFGEPGSHVLYSYRVDTATGALTRAAEVNLTGTASQLNGVVTDTNGRFVYVSDPGNQHIYGFSVAANGTMTPLAGSPWIWMSGAYSHDMSVDGRLICGISVVGRGYGLIRCMERDPATGVLGETIDGPAEISYSRVAFTANGYLVVSNGAQLDVFGIDAAANRMTRVAGAPFATAPQSWGGDGFGQWLAVAGGEKISVFNVSSAGALAPVAASPFAAPGMLDVQYTESGRFLIATGNGQMMVFRVESTGALTQVGSTITVGQLVSAPATLAGTAP